MKKKEKEMIEDQKAGIRLKALKEQDMKTYFKLVEMEKNNKIKELLSQTDRFLKELGAKVMIQKGNTQDDNDEVAAEEKKEQDDTLETNFNNSNRVYYNLTHTVKE